MSDAAIRARLLSSAIIAVDNHGLATILKMCAAELQSRQLPGHQLGYDVAFEIHNVASTIRARELYARYWGGPPPS